MGAASGSEWPRRERRSANLDLWEGLEHLRSGGKLRHLLPAWGGVECS